MAVVDRMLDGRIGASCVGLQRIRSVHTLSLATLPKLGWPGDFLGQTMHGDGVQAATDSQYSGFWMACFVLVTDAHFCIMLQWGNHRCHHDACFAVTEHSEVYSSVPTCTSL